MPKAKKSVSTLTAPQNLAASVLGYYGYQKGQRQKNGALAVAADEAKVTKQTIHNWLKLDEFVERIEFYTVRPAYLAMKKLVEKVEDGDTRCILEALDRFAPHMTLAYVLQQQRHDQELERLDRLGKVMPEGEAVLEHRIIVREATAADFAEVEPEHDEDHLNGTTRH
jgi:hypothetical protein